MVRIFTHKKRTYWGCDRQRVDFKITVDHINFTSNQYFLANSHYVIFRKQNKKKQFVSKNRVIHAKDLKMVHIDEKIKFRTCMFQDMTYRYLERYMPKNKRFVVRQVTAVTNEELYVNCGYFELPLDIYGMQPSGQEIEVPFVDPNGKAAGTVYLIIEHEPKVPANYLPNFSKSFQNYFFPAPTHKSPLPPSRLERNREKLDFVKQQQIEHHWSHKYDGLSSDGEGDDTLSESDLGSDAEQDHNGSGNFNSQSFIMNRTGMPQVSTKSLSSKNAYLSVHLDSAMFHFEDASSDLPTPTNNRENAAFQANERLAGASASGSVTRIVSFDPQTIEAPSVDTISTLSQSERGHISPRAQFSDKEAPAETKPEPKVEPAPVSPHHIEIPHHVTAKPGNTHVPFVGQSYKVRAGAALQEDTEDEQSQSQQSTTQPSEQANVSLQPAVQVEELWEDVADFEKLEEREQQQEQPAEGSYKPRKSLRTAPPPLISDSSQFIPARTVQRSASMTEAGMRDNLPRYEPPPPVPQPPRKSLRGAPPPVVEKEAYIPAKVVHRMNSESSASMAQYMLNMDSVDEREQAAKGNTNNYIPPFVPKPTEKKVERVERTERTERGEKKERNVRSPSPAARHLVPVRLTAAQSASLELGQPATSLASHSLSPVGSQSHQRHLPHRAQSTGDMYAGIGHRHSEPQDVVSPVSVKELRRKYEPSYQRPPMDREPSGGTTGTSGSDSYTPYAPLSPKNLPKAVDGAINVRRTTSERSYSTLSTHTDLPKRHAQNGSGGAGGAKLLVPVRMQHPSEELAYNQYNQNNNMHSPREQEISPLSTSTYNTTNTHRSQGQGPSQSHQLHRGVSQYTGERPYLTNSNYNNHSSGRSEHSSGSSNALDFDLRQEQHERYDRYHQQHAQAQSRDAAPPQHRSGSSGRPLPVPVREQAPAPAPRSNHHYQEPQYQPSSSAPPVSRGHHRSHSDVLHSSAAPYPAHSSANKPPHHTSTNNTSHHLAPPIRLTQNDYVPPQYERYVVEKHHTHVHVHGADKGNNGNSNGYYNAPQTRPGPPTAYRGVYA